jgi:hypothetical protein
MVRITVLNTTSCDLYIKDIQDEREMKLLHPDLDNAAHTTQYLQDAVNNVDGTSVAISLDKNNASQLNFSVNRETKYGAKSHILYLFEKSVHMKQQQSSQQSPQQQSPQQLSQSQGQGSTPRSKPSESSMSFRFRFTIMIKIKRIMSL